MNELESNLVTVGQPVEGGCVYTCFDDEYTLPTSATETLGEGFVSLGEISDQGYTEGQELDTTDFKGWHGTSLLVAINSQTNTYQMEFVETSRPAVAKLRFGAENIEEGDDGSVSHIAGKALNLASVPLVIDELESNGCLRRTVVHKAQVTAFDDVPHQRGSLLVYGMTFTAIDDDGMFDTYRAEAASA